MYALENLLQRAPFGPDVAVAPVLRYRGFLRTLAARPANLLVQFPLEFVCFVKPKNIVFEIFCYSSKISVAFLRMLCYYLFTERRSRH